MYSTFGSNAALEGRLLSRQSWECGNIRETILAFTNWLGRKQDPLAFRGSDAQPPNENPLKPKYVSMSLA